MKHVWLSHLQWPMMHAGLGILLTLIGAPLAPETLGLIQQTVMGAAGLLAMVVTEKSAP